MNNNKSDIFSVEQLESRFEMEMVAGGGVEETDWTCKCSGEMGAFKILCQLKLLNIEYAV